MGNAGGYNKKEYILTLDTAKHIAMLEKNEQGRKIRQAFIDFEKEHNKPLTFEEMAKQTIALANERIKALESKMEEDRPRVTLAKAIEVSAGAINITDFIRVLKEEGVNISQKKSIDWLFDEHILFRQGKTLKAYAQYIDDGYFEMTEVTVIAGEKTITKLQLKVTGKGQVWLGDKLKKQFG